MNISTQKAVSAGASVRRVEPHRLFVLDDPSKVWVVAAGAGEIVSTLVEEGFPVGARRVICRVGVGDTLFPLVRSDDAPPHLLVILGEEEITLLGMPADRLVDVCTAIGADPIACAAGWAEKVSSFLVGGPAPATAEVIEPGASLRLDAGQMVRSGRNCVTWVRILEGAALLLGMDECRVGCGPDYLPLAGSLFITTAEPVRIIAAREGALDASGTLCAGIAKLHKLLSYRLADLDASDQRRDLLRLEDRGAAQERRANASFEEMASVLNPRKVTRARRTSLLGAAALVGEVLGVAIEAPPRSDDSQGERDPIDAIARASRVRHRRVLLRGVWWKRDCGPLIGYLADGRRPVALLRTPRAKYEIVDPESGERKPVTNRTAMSLSPDATMLYQRLPDVVTSPRQLVRFLLRGRAMDISFVIALAVMATLLGMLGPLATVLVMDTAIPGADTGLLIQLGLALVAAAVGALLFDLAQGFVSIRMGIASDAASQGVIWDRLLNLRVSFFSRFSTGDLLSRVTAVSEVGQELNGATVQSVLAAMMSLLNLGLLAFLSLRLALVAMGLALAVMAVTAVGGLYLRKRLRTLMDLRGSFFGLVVQMVGCVSKIRVAGAQKRAFTTWVNEYTRQLKLVRDTQYAQDCLFIFNQTVPTIGLILLFWVGVGLLAGGGVGSGAGAPLMSVGIFLAFNTAMGTFLRGATALSTTVVDTLETVSKGKRISAILEAEQEVDESKVDPGKLAGGVSLSRVDFRYTPGGRKVLEDVSLRADPGEFIALVGPSGSGKSTVFRLLLGFESPETGAVSFDGKDLDGIDTTAVRRQLGVVLQSGRITAGSILDNIGAGVRVTLDEAWEAVEDAGLAEDIRAMPMGMHTVVSEGGTNFSGGQRQRLLIARALITDPRILLMDEATSALDNRSQKIVSDSLQRRNVTRIVVAHRLSTIHQADRIYVLDRGRVIEQGTYDELAAGGGLFRTLLARQQA